MGSRQIPPQWLNATKGDNHYEALRKRYYNGRVPDELPSRIFCPKTTEEVAAIVIDAKTAKAKVGVRSGGHLVPCCSLLDGGILIDTINLNRNIDFDPDTNQISFSPAESGKTLAPVLDSRDRFFPFGHAPSVGIGGFLLCGGQGWFMRGWGCTSDTWIEALQIVTADGLVVTASKDENQDLFWAARGSGQGFFGVVTRITSRTVPAKKLYETAVTFDATDRLKEIIDWSFQCNDESPRYGVDTALTTYYPNKMEQPEADEITDRRIFATIFAIAWADSLDEAQSMTARYKDVPESLQKSLLHLADIHETTWGQLFATQDAYTPVGGTLRWQCDSILNNPEVNREKLINTILPALYDLPSRRSVGTIYFADYYPDGDSCALSLPQQYYISSMTCWSAEEEDTRMRKWMLDTYKKLEPVSAGQYIADFDVSHRIERVMSDAALAKWLGIREKYDANGMFPGYIGFATNHRVMK